MPALRQVLPILVVLAAVIALGYPLALVFGLPLARRDLSDLRKWKKELVTSPAPSDLTPLAEGGAITFSPQPGRSVLVLEDHPLEVEPDTDANAVAAAAGRPLLVPGKVPERLTDLLYRFPVEALAGEGAGAIYAGTRLLKEGTSPAAERPDGKRLDFTFEGAEGPVLVANRLLLEGEGFNSDQGRVILSEAPPFGSEVRRIAADYAVLDAVAGSVALARPAAAPLQWAQEVVRLAERLGGESDGVNRLFTLEHTPVLENDRGRALYLDDSPLRGDGERPSERVSGERATFTFESASGLVVLDSRVLIEGTDYHRSGAEVVFVKPPVRNARLRLHPDYLLVDPERGEVLLAEPPMPGAILWVAEYSYYSEPACGPTLYQCFLALPQHPVPFPHWIARRVAPFMSKFPLNDERNVVRATLYTTLGTLAALGLGGIVGILLAVVFVLFRPLERALLPWVVASQTIPIIALVPVLLLVLGNFGITIQTSLLPTALIGAYIVFFPVVVGTVKGLRSIDPLALDLMRSYAATPSQLFLKIRFPAAVPFLFTSLKLGTAAALVGALVAETESNNRRGLGFQILGQVQSGNVADVWILLILSGLLGIGLVALVGLLERIFAPWKRV